MFLFASPQCCIRMFIIPLWWENGWKAFGRSLKLLTMSFTLNFPSLHQKQHQLPACCLCVYIYMYDEKWLQNVSGALSFIPPPPPPPCLSSELLFSFLCYKFPLGQIVTGEERSPDTRGGEEGGGGEKMERMSNDRKRINECRKGKIENENEE